MSFWSKLEQSAKEAQPSAAPLPPTREQEEGAPMAISKREESPTGATGTSDLLLGHGAEFEGKLTFAGTVRIDAKFKGSIMTNDVLVVGEHAKIDADITCGTIVVHGEVNGNINAKTAIELRSQAKVRGDIETPSLMIEKGAHFQGQSKMPERERSSPVKMVGADLPGGGPEGSS